MASPKSKPATPAATRPRTDNAVSPIKLGHDYGLTKRQLAETIGLRPKRSISASASAQRRHSRACAR